jgi:hypothetical protein
MDPDQTAKAGLDPCWLQAHYVDFVMAWLIIINIEIDNKKNNL